MSVLTDFFVASPEELADIFPAWFAVADEPSIQEVENPFTGQKQTVTRWLPLGEYPANVAPDELPPNYGQVEHCESNRVDHVKLARLNVLLSGGEVLERMQQFNRPALIEPAQADETGLHRLADDFVAALSSVSEPEIIAANWAATEEMQLDQFTADDCAAVLRELARLAVIAVKAQKGLYFWWSL